MARWRDHSSHCSNLRIYINNNSLGGVDFWSFKSTWCLIDPRITNMPRNYITLGFWLVTNWKSNDSAQIQRSAKEERLKRVRSKTSCMLNGDLPVHVHVHYHSGLLRTRWINILGYVLDRAFRLLLFSSFFDSGTGETPFFEATGVCSCYR